MPFSALALDLLPDGEQLRHMRELGNTPPPVTKPSNSAATGKPPPPVLISDGLPPVPAKLVKRIHDGSYVEMAELLTATLISRHYEADDHTASHRKTSKEVTDIMDWIQCFGMYVAIVSLKSPHRIPDLIGYQNLIVQSSIDSHEGRWIIYDRRFCLKASATTIPEWSAIDITVWRMPFPERPPAISNYRTPRSLPCKPPAQSFRGGPPPASATRVCLEWNESPDPGCPRPSCRFDHICYRCVQTNIVNKKHKAIFFPYKQKWQGGSPSTQKSTPHGAYRNP